MIKMNKPTFYILNSFLLIFLLSIFVPFTPLMPAIGLDESWKFSMNELLAQGFAFGKDSIFTFGPYTALYTKQYHPYTDALMLVGTIYLSFFYWLALIRLLNDAKVLLFFAFIALLVLTVNSRDALFLIYPLLVALNCNIISRKISINADTNRLDWVIITLLFSPLGLLPLVKGTMLLLCASMSGLCFLNFYYLNRRLLASLCLISPLISLFVFWLISGQNIINLPSYFINMRPIVSGYSEAMLINSDISDIICYLLAFFFIIFSIYKDQNDKLQSKIFLLAVFSIFLFISFKAGFVRHDSHALIAALAILSAALLLPLFIKNKIYTLAIFFSILSLFNVYNNQYRIPYNAVSSLFWNNVKTTYKHTRNGIIVRAKNPKNIETRYESAIQQIQDTFHIPKLPGTVDIFSYNQSFLIASDNNWSPRPILQSYSAYSPELSRANKSHLLGNKAPTYIVFGIETIDGRIPSLDDGESWPVLLKNYKIEKILGNYLLLAQNDNENTDPFSNLLYTEQTKLRKKVVLPEHTDLLYINFEVKPTLLGKLMATIYKPSPLTLKINLKDGSRRYYKLISRMGESGFIISPLIEQTTEFYALYQSPDQLNSKLVESISLSAKRNRIFRQWKSHYKITLSETPYPEKQELPKYKEQST